MSNEQPPGLIATHELLRPAPGSLDVFFSAKTVAVIGATERPGSVGRTLLWNLVSSPFGGTVFPINARHPSILGIKAYPRIADTPMPVELAVIATPAPTVPDVIAECAAAGVKGAIIISAGFREAGAEGMELERRVRAASQAAGLRIVGPNCLGVMSPRTGLNATFASTMARPGTVGFISQSGALLTAILDWSLQENVGFSAFVSLGSMLDVGWGELIDYLAEDPLTKSIVIYMESVGDAKAFLSAARAAALRKPILVIKAGRTAAAAKAVASHTGTLTGSDDVLEAAFRRAGVIRVSSIGELFAMADVLAKQPRPAGPRLTVVTNAGGPGVLATDALIAGGGELAQPTAASLAALDAMLPPHWSHGNPVDVLGDAPAERYARAVEICAKDPDSDGLLVILTPQAMTDPTGTAELIRPLAKLSHKPILASWMGGAGVAAGRAILHQAEIPNFNYPDAAVRAFLYLWRYSYNLRALYETPTLFASDNAASARSTADEIVRAARGTGRALLTEWESKRLLSAYGIPTVETRIAGSEDEAAEAARSIGFPVVLKLHSTTITHKTDVGGVQLNLADETAVRAAWRRISESVAERVGPQHFGGVTVQPMVRQTGYELIVGSIVDEQFGPVLLFGAGGQLVEVIHDRALALPPLNATLALRMMQQTKIFRALEGVRGRKPVDVAALEHLLVRFSQLVVEQRWIREIDINPLLAGDEGLIALDARVVLHPADTEEEDLPRLAIRPYPAQYVTTLELPDHTVVRVRPIRPEDEPLLVKFHEKLSEDTVYNRYSQMLKLSQRVAHERLSRICFIDYQREMTLIAEIQAVGEPEIVGVVRLVKVPGTGHTELSLVISDHFQRKGLGTRLAQCAVDVARAERMGRLVAYMLPVNRGMQRVCERLGFELRHDSDTVIGHLDL
ncbi:MAG TPA: bifunctional acetate--CoA ligase family protein/GNAT family N-acetyltransferase [Pirellulales bacterium]|jgi:acetyltransferase|nr:bifunctional acetate--CoA ligase family protein/GNAT family N-acetyltransferase [Pirellulales bacterium]